MLVIGDETFSVLPRQRGASRHAPQASALHQPLCNAAEAPGAFVLVCGACGASLRGCEVRPGIFPMSLLFSPHPALCAVQGHAMTV